MATPDKCCIRPEICEYYRFLKKRLRRTQPKKRIQKLAKPKWLNFLEPKLPKCRRFRIDIEKSYPDRIVGTRTEQLAFVSMRKLLEFRDNWSENFHWKRVASINKHIRRSLLSMYSRLYNIQAPIQPEPKKNWTKKDWEDHAADIKRLATAKKEIELPPPERKKKPLSAFRRIDKMATPKKHTIEEPSSWKFTPEMKNYKPTKRIKAIAVPKEVPEDIHYREIPFKIKKSALKYKATARTKTLATAQEKKGAVTDIKENAFKIAPNALKAKPSPRTKELAEPKEYEEIKERSQAISPAALKAKASQRTIELAKPRYVREKYVSPSKK